MIDKRLPDWLHSFLKALWDQTKCFGTIVLTYNDKKGVPHTMQ